MATHMLSMIDRYSGKVCAADPAECRAHFAAGRVPVYEGRKLIAYVDQPEDLPDARFFERDGRLVGMLDPWLASEVSQLAGDQR